MKILLIICGVVLVLQLAVLGYSFSGGGDPPADEELRDGEWNAGEEYPMTEWANGLLSPFRPHIKIFNNGLDQPIAGAEQREIEYRHESDDKRVIAEFDFISGYGVLIKYQCGILNRKGFTCPEQVICLCSEGRPINIDDFSVCGSARPKGDRCPEEGNVGKIIVYSKRGKFLLHGLGDEGGRVRAN